MEKGKMEMGGINHSILVSNNILPPPPSRGIQNLKTLALIVAENYVREIFIDFYWRERKMDK